MCIRTYLEGDCDTQKTGNPPATETGNPDALPSVIYCETFSAEGEIGLDRVVLSKPLMFEIHRD